jgi:hypothetical protein
LLLTIGRDFRPDDAARQVDRDVGARDGKFLDRRIAGTADLADRAVELILGSFVAVGFDLPAGVVGIAAGFFKHRPNFTGRGCEPGLVLGQHFVRIVKSGCCRGDRVCDLPFALV